MAAAQDLVQQFSSELLLHESQQVLQPGRPVRYADGEAGERLRRLLDPARTGPVVDAVADAARRGVPAPDVNLQIKALLDRYARAFEQSPADYEAEYLDALSFSISTVRRSIADLAQPPAPVAGESGAAQLLTTARSLVTGFSGMMERVVRQKIASNAFSPAGRVRAEALADELASARGALVEVRMRAVYGGQEAYEQQCFVCHAAGVAGAPRFGDRAAWARRLDGGFDALVRSTLRGKGAMPPQAGGDLQEVELARATAWLANSGGAAFAEPDLPAGHAGVVRIEVPRHRAALPPPAPSPAAFGEKLYAMNCQVCHHQGQAMGPFPALLGARSLQSGGTALRVILQGRGAMPAWRHLPDHEVAELANYVMARFGAGKAKPVTPEDVRRAR